MVPNNHSYKVSHRNIKYPRVELKTGELLFILPLGYSSDIFYEKHKSWIFKKISFIEGCLDSAGNKELPKRSDGEFEKLVCKVIKEMTNDLEIKINKIYLRKMRTKWASLSSFKNLTVNRSMKYLPEYLVEYIIFHELVHIIEKKHNSQFWGIISRKYNDYQKLERELFEYWFKVSEKIGTYANNFTLYDLNKDKVSLSDFQGKIIVLNFWASWCPPCVQEAPEFVETYDSYKTKGVQFLGVSNDDVNALKKFIKDKKIDYPTLLDGSIDKIMPKWGINAIPATFIIGRDGEILFHNVGLMTKDQLINSIEKYLNS